MRQGVLVCMGFAPCEEIVWILVELSHRVPYKPCFPDCNWGG